MRHWVIALALLCMACDQNRQTSGGAGEPQATATGGGGTEERFYGQERFTIVMTHSGRQTGTTTMHVRDWGRRRAELNDTSISVAGYTQRVRNRVVYEGARVITVNLDNNTATAITNPLYDQVVAGMRGRTGVEFGREIMTQMGGRPTGERGSFAGHACEYWEAPSLGARTCVTQWGATLHLVSALGGVSVEQTATEVRVGDGGPDAAFAYDAASVTEGPNLGDIMGPR